jgi:cytoskeletal protein CcmA (bactofilin family)
MWWSKQTQSAELSFSPAFSSTGVMDAPIEAPASQPARAIPNTSISTSVDRGANRDMACSEDLYLDAVIEGSFSLNCKRLTIGQRAKANADVVAREVVVYGELAGHLHAADRIEIKKHASVTGELTTRRILIEDGAYFKGTVQIERRRQPRDTSPSLI